MDKHVFDYPVPAYEGSMKRPMRRFYINVILQIIITAILNTIITYANFGFEEDFVSKWFYSFQIYMVPLSIVLGIEIISRIAFRYRSLKRLYTICWLFLIIVTIIHLYHTYFPAS